MAEGDDLVAAGKDYLVVADYSPPADGVYPYLGVLALAAVAVAVVT